MRGEPVPKHGFISQQAKETFAEEKAIKTCKSVHPVAKKKPGYYN